MSFGKRQSGAVAPALGVDMAVASRQVVSNDARTTRSPLRLLIVLIACGVMLYGLLASYGPDILRDHRRNLAAGL